MWGGGGGVCPCLGALYMYMTIIFKHFFTETAWPIKAKFLEEHPWEGETKVCINSLDHMTKLASMPIYGKKPLKVILS